MSHNLKKATKFLLLIIFLPFTLIFVKNSLSILIKIPGITYFFLGAGVYCFFYIFLDELKFLFEWNRKMVEKIFPFFHPFIKVAYFTIPFLVLLISTVQMFLKLQTKIVLDSALLILMGFFSALHIILSCSVLKPKKGTFLEINYLFNLTFIFLISSCIILAALKPFFTLSIVNIFDITSSELKTLLVALYTQLFIPHRQV